MKKIIYKNGTTWGFKIPKRQIEVKAVGQRSFYYSDYRFCSQIGEEYFYDLCDEWGIDAYSAPRIIGED